jgi:2-polyprenyl-3-methyl-5-hydroxy-6-metoxy-1,4-benzoquinol methylase
MWHAPAVEELRDCTIDEVRNAWDRTAKAWSTFIRSRLDEHREHLHGPALLEACGSVGGRRALDLGCGEGWCSRELVSRGASVAAVDVCGAMIAEACAHPLQPDQHVQYLVMDAVHVDRHDWPAPFDLITACMSLHTMPDPAGALRAARRTLASDGRLVCSIPHPLTHMMGGRQCLHRQDGALHLRAGDYFRSAPYRVRWDVPGTSESWDTIRWSRSLGEYTGMLRSAGFVVQDLREPFASWTEVEEHARLRTAGELPSYLVVVAEPALRPTPPD